MSTQRDIHQSQWPMCLVGRTHSLREPHAGRELDAPVVYDFASGDLFYGRKAMGCLRRLGLQNHAKYDPVLIFSALLNVAEMNLARILYHLLINLVL